MLSDVIQKNISRMIENNNMSYEQLAYLLNYNVLDIERLISGDLFLPPKELWKIANLFGITLEELCKK